MFDVSGLQGDEVGLIHLVVGPISQIPRTRTHMEERSNSELRRSLDTPSEWCAVPVGMAAQIRPPVIAEKHYRRPPIDLLHQQVA